ncbi:p21-activated protein kinase-interacting protein, putative [Phytophthora infestans T30-4]|uniref:p21-activated protein kinase-interacting protein, putative n=1 Tax=Phytophthora infestans (strain T30-4) TaxID=403677 RepID=D0NLK2_PHYIT|nr:p21-activated protein kinase-interacting protein, putative [Phytophthora infestans T30-4]EEY60549.1 p21-activated protein kinase-interacting protein, putative [Phytophthora infestans T30-4]|eukprot:XP_002899922.1 p21-activated protein kinase-interacting protein, putative [Phytophthora infestans T30-4]
MIRVVAGTYEGLLYGWECPTVTTGERTKMKLTFGYAAHSECIKSVALMAAKQGKTLLSGSSDEMIKIYNVDKGVEVGSLMEQHGAISSLEFFGQSHVLSGSADNFICIWRTSDWNCLHILGGHKGEINSIAVHPSGKLCFSVARDRTLRMWNLVKGRIAFIRRLEKEAELVMISQKGTHYALGFGKDLSVFNMNAELVGTLEHSKKIHCAAFATDEYVVCGGDDKQIFIWKTNGTYVLRRLKPLVGKVTHKDIDARIRCLQVVYPHGEDKLPWIVLATSDGAFQIWDFASFTLDESSPEEANKLVEPIASTVLLTKPRVTCLSVCAANEKAAKEATVSEDTTTKIKKTMKSKKVTEKKLSAPAAGIPHVVVELDAGESKAEDEGESSTKRKSTGETQRKNKNKKRKHKK